MHFCVNTGCFNDYVIVFSSFSAGFSGQKVELVIQLNFYVILQRAGLVLLLVLAAIIISLAIACLGYNGSKPTINDPIMEQVPLTISAIAAVSIEFGFCAVVLLPVYWIALFSITIPIICLIGQEMWLSRVYYSIWESR